MPKPIRQTQKTHSIAPSQTLIAPIAPPARLIAPSQTLIASIVPSARSSHPSTDPPKTDRSRRIPKPIILDPDSSSPTQLRRPHSSNPVASLCLSQFDRIWWISFFFFLLGFVCFVFIYWEMILIFVWKLRKCEKHDKNGFSRAFSRIQPNTWKYFSLSKIAFSENIYFPENILREPNTAK